MPKDLLPVVLAAVCLVRGWAFAGEGAVSVNAGAEARRLQAEFQRARSAAERREFAEGLLGLGPDGARRLHGAARGKLFELLSRYTAGYEKAATKLLETRLSAGNAKAEIEVLRRAVRGVAARPGLTREMIVQESDPALARLEAILVVTPEQVFAEAPELSSDREDLLGLAEQADRARRLIPEEERARLRPRSPDGGIRRAITRTY